MFRKISLPEKYKPRKYQSDFLETGLQLLESDPHVPHLFSSPTGTGKTWMQLMMMAAMEDTILMTPRIEIIDGTLQKLGHYTEDMNDSQLASLGWEYGIITPIRFRTMLAEGRLDTRPRLLIKDECFPGDTFIATPKGQTRIDTLKVGDSVYAFDSIKREFRIRNITKVFKNPKPAKMVHIRALGGFVVTSTENHPFFVCKNKSETLWLEATNIKIGDEVLVTDAYLNYVWSEVVEINNNVSVDFAPRHVYNLEVEEFHTYIANGIVVHNCHHDEADSWKDIDMYLNGVPQIGLTATPFRGTPKGTNAFLEKWNDTINQVLSLKDAVEQGYYQIPTPIIWPMIDDDVIDITGGEFKIRTLEALVFDRIKSIAEQCKQFYINRARMYDMPTMIALPSTASVLRFCEIASQIGLTVKPVTQATTRRDRKLAFQACEDMTHMLVQINVISEGVDLKIRRIIDCKSTMSPVHWMQQVGRIRPEKDSTPQYICCNRNLERHGYLMEGLLPSTAFKEAQEAFGKPSKRAGSRGVGLEGLGKFKSIPMRLKNGITIQCYNLTTVDAYKKQEYFVIVHPQYPETVQGVREMKRNEDGTIDWRSGSWKLLESIPDMQGFNSAKPFPLTEKQEKRWKQDAEKTGLDVHQLVDARSIQAFFFLRDTGIRFK